MKSETGKFSFKVPDDAIDKATGGTHADAGKKLENQPFDYEVPEDESDVETILEKKGWTILGLVADLLKANARASAYQNKIALYKPSEVSADDIKARMIRDYVRMGVSEENARKTVEQNLANLQGQ